TQKTINDWGIEMKKSYRVKDHKKFQDIIYSGKSFANRELVIYYKEKATQRHFRIGISVGKKIGNAVQRNKIKRHLREAFHYLEDQIKPSVDIIIRARKHEIHMNTSDMVRSVSHLLKRQRLFTNK